MKLIEKVKYIDQFVRENAWFDFQVVSFECGCLVIHGGIDLTVGRQLEIKFENVLCYHGPFDWRSDTSKTVFDTPAENEIPDINIKYEIEVGYNVFRFQPEYHNDPIIIGAVDINQDIGDAAYG